MKHSNPRGLVWNAFWLEQFPELAQDELQELVEKNVAAALKSYFTDEDADTLMFLDGDAFGIHMDVGAWESFERRLTLKDAVIGMLECYSDEPEQREEEREWLKQTAFALDEASNMLKARINEIDAMLPSSDEAGPTAEPSLASLN